MPAATVRQPAQGPRESRGRRHPPVRCAHEPPAGILTSAGGVVPGRRVKNPLRSVVWPVARTGAQHVKAKWASREGEGRQAGSAQLAVSRAGVSQPLVSLLVPTWNYRSFLGQCLDSVMAQTYPNLQVVVVDDCSNDGSLEIAQHAAQRDARISVTRNPDNLGAFGNSLRCLELASGDAVMFVGADDVLRPDAVDLLVAALGRSPATVLSFGSFEQIDPMGAVASRQPPQWLWQPATPVWTGQGVGDEMLRRCRNLIGSPTAVMFRKDALADPNALPGFLPGRQPLFDLLWWLRNSSATVTWPGSEPSSAIGGCTGRPRRARWEHTPCSSTPGEHCCGTPSRSDTCEYPPIEAEAWSSFLLLNGGLLARPAHWRGSSRFARSLASNVAGATRRLSDLASADPASPPFSTDVRPLVTRPDTAAPARQALSSLNRRYRLKARAEGLLAVGEQLTTPLRRRQLQGLHGFGGKPLMVHLGCGTVGLPGWVNVDVGRRSAADVHWDLRHGLPLPARSVALYYSEHFFEHLTRSQGQRLFGDLARTLQLDGVVRIAMPDSPPSCATTSTAPGATCGPCTIRPSRSIDTPAHYINVTFREWGTSTSTTSTSPVATAGGRFLAGGTVRARPVVGLAAEGSRDS